MKAPQYITDDQGNRMAVVLDLETYREMLEALEDADDAHFYREGKAEIAGAEMLSVDQARAELEAFLASNEQAA